MSTRCLEEVRKERLDLLRTRAPGGALDFARCVLGERATYLKDLNQLTEDDLTILWYALTTYSRERDWVIEALIAHKQTLEEAGNEFGVSEDKSPNPWDRNFYSHPDLPRVTHDVPVLKKV